MDPVSAPVSRSTVAGDSLTFYVRKVLWPAHLSLATRHWGQPDYIGDESSVTFVDEWEPGAGTGRRHLAVWLRPGAQIHLYSNKPSKDPLTTSVGVNYAVYID